MSSDPNDRSDAEAARHEPAEPSPPPEPKREAPAPTAPEPAEQPPVGEMPAPDSASTEPSPPDAADAEPGSAETKPRRRILIGSQRDPAAYRPKVTPDSVRIVGLKRRQARKRDRDRDQGKPEPQPPVEAPTDASPPQPAAESSPPPAAQVSAEAPMPPPAEPPPQDPVPAASEPAAPALPTPVDEPPVEEEPSPQPVAGRKFPPPNIRDRLPPDLEQEFQAALSDVPLDDLMAGDDQVTKQPMLESDSRHTGRVVMIRKEDVFIELGGREQGILPLKQFDEPPQVGDEVRVRVARFNREDGLYELSRMGSAASVADWSDLEEGMLVEARITGQNTGGLECEVNHIRGFIPVSQVSLYRVDDLSEFVGEKLPCLVTECNPRRRNLVLSRRAVLEREQEEARKQLLESLEPGQVREGVVRKLVDFGAFVDLGGVDGLLHVSQLAWGRVNHPREVLHEGQHVKVKVESVDKESRRISLAYRDLFENPWENVEMKYPVTTTVHGKVTKLMEYGAFVELEPGVEGLVHVSELSHKRVWRVSDVVKEGDEIDAVVLSVDREAQRISLSIKELIEPPKPAAKDESKPDEPAPPPKRRREPSKPLQGGLGRSPGGQNFGLKW
jgi:small subunit ribosomal protein S1